ncbi:MAG: hypothetical protein ACOYLQ_18830 [Hyphomicrobiaceae bacterium]
MSASVRLAWLATALVVSTALPAVAADKLLKVDWSNTEISRFIGERAANPLLSVGAADDVKLAKLKLPVLGFDVPPKIVANSFAAEARPRLARKIIMDEANPVWYQIVDRYGDLTITVEADLRIQHELPANTPIYGPGGQGAAAEPQISVFDARSEVGMEGAIAEYTVYKYPDIPYTVKMECTARNKEQCQDIPTISGDRGLLKLLSARPQ